MSSQDIEWREGGRGGGRCGLSISSALSGHWTDIMACYTVIAPLLSIVPAPENTVIIRENIPAQPGAPSQVNSGIKDKQQEQRGEIK